MEGQRIGNYRIVRKIGQGGMGSVWEAKHEQLHRKAAIKLLRRELTTDPQVEIRFFNEAKAASRVDHPSIVKIDEFGHLPDGTAYIIMEYLSGDPLSVRLRNLGGKLQLPDTLRISRQIASALAATHAKGIVHRDLKPDNVMLVPDSEVAGGERVKILDFGIAKVITDYSGPGAEEFKTNTGLVLGTATYMAPEQCKGAGDVTEKADVYSLAVVMYRMCCGKVPFRAEGPGEVMAMHIFSQPKPLREVDPRVPEPLAALIHRMMSKEPHERPTMTQVATELEKMAMTITGPVSVPTVTAPVAAVAAPAATGAAEPVAASSSAASQPSTLGTALGQSGSAPAVPVGSRSRAGWLVAAVLLLGGVGVSIPYGLHHMPQLLARKAKPVYWNVASSPVAQVIRKADGQVMGSTPWTYTLPQGTGRQLFVLRADGYVEQEVWFDEASSATQNVTLVAEPKAPSEPVIPDGGSTGSAPVIVIQDGGATAGSAVQVANPTERPVPSGANGQGATEKPTVGSVKAGRSSGFGAAQGAKGTGNKPLPRLGSEAELLKDDDIAILKDD